MQEMQEQFPALQNLNTCRPWHKTQLWVIWEFPEGRATLCTPTWMLVDVRFLARLTVQAI